MILPFKSSASTTARRGSAYLFVLATTVLVVTAGLATALTSRLSIRSVNQNANAQRAEALAESAVSWGLAQISANSNWRTTYTSNVECASASFGGGSISFRVVDENDGTLSNTSTQPIRLYGTGTYGNAVKVLSVRVAGADPLTCLNTALCVGGSISLSSAQLSAPGRAIVCNLNFNGGDSLSSVTGNLYAGGTITPNGCTISGSQSASSTPRVLPDSSVFEYYLANGTRIPFSSLDTGELKDRVISPASSSFSGVPANPKGIYIIDCGGNSITIKECRIVGTLVLLNTGANSVVGGYSNNDCVNWTPAYSNLPCLLVQGNIKIANGKNGSMTLSESGANTNFNPSGAPFPFTLLGLADLDKLDTYPAIIDGLVYISGNVSVTSGATMTPTVGNTIVGGNFLITSNQWTFSYKAIYNALPPPGFSGGGTMQPIPGTYRWETAP